MLEEEGKSREKAMVSGFCLAVTTLDSDHRLTDCYFTLLNALMPHTSAPVLKFVGLGIVGSSLCFQLYNSDDMS